MLEMNKFSTIFNKCKKIYNKIHLYIYIHMDKKYRYNIIRYV